MKVKVTAPNEIRQCTIVLPPSKSIANRVLIMSALNGIPPSKVLRQPMTELCDDIRVVVEMLQSEDSIVNVGAAGTAMRFATAFLAVSKGSKTITGTARLQERPIGILVDALRLLGADIEYLGKTGYPPLKIKGNPEMQGGAISLDGSVSSQFISALLMIAPVLKNGLVLKLKGQVVSVPYINITVGLMKRFGAIVGWMSKDTIAVSPGYNYTDRDGFVQVESDWTAASYWYEIASIANLYNPFKLPGLMADSLQGDKVCDSIYKLISQHRLAGSMLEYDFKDCPDLVQTVVVTCCMEGIPFHFTGLRTLRIKETDRILALQTELTKLGYYLETSDDAMTWNGRFESVGVVPPIATYNDHRMAMAFAPCALKFENIIIEDPSVVNKSYPTYWSDLEKAGFVLCYI